MTQNKKINITEQELDTLLSMSFLNLDSSQTKNSQIMEKVAGTALTGFTFLSPSRIMVSATLIAIVGVAAWYLNPGRSSSAGDRPDKSDFTVAVPVKRDTHKPVYLSDKDKVQGQTVVFSKPVRDAVPGSQLSEVRQTDESPMLDEASDLSGLMISPERNPGPTMDEYIFPVLTEKEIRTNEKNKKQMLKLLMKLNEHQYPRIPASTGAYYMKAAEVSNKEYRTFLFDLLIKGRKSDFLKAKPQQDLWLNAAGQTSFNELHKTYFTEKKYDDYPVVNVTTEGAEMFCAWMSEELALLNSEGAKNKLQVNLPSEQEWLFAAHAGRPAGKFSWPHDSVQNIANCFMANCCIQRLKHEISHPICNNHHKLDQSCYTSAGMMLRDSTEATTLVWSYNPSAYGLFTMCGNVSELVYTGTSKNTKAVGGNWASDFHHLVIGTESEFPLDPPASPMIGFRVCVKKIQH